MHAAICLEVLSSCKVVQGQIGQAQSRSAVERQTSGVSISVMASGVHGMDFYLGHASLGG